MAETEKLQEADNTTPVAIENLAYLLQLNELNLARSTLYFSLDVFVL
jgi:hypothetical protein